MGYHYISIKTAKFIMTDHTKCWQECRTIITLILSWQKYKMVQPIGKTGKQFLIKISIYLAYNPVIPHLSFYWRIKSMWTHIDLYVNVYGSFVYNSQKLGTTRFINWWTNKLWWIYTMGYCSITKNYKLQMCTTWVKKARHI